MGQLEDHEAIQNAVRDQDAVLITLGGYGILTMDTTSIKLNFKLIIDLLSAQLLRTIN